MQFRLNSTCFSKNIHDNGAIIQLWPGHRQKHKSWPVPMEMDFLSLRARKWEPLGRKSSFRRSFAAIEPHRSSHLGINSQSDRLLIAAAFLNNRPEVQNLRAAASNMHSQPQKMHARTHQVRMLFNGSERKFYWSWRVAPITRESAEFYCSRSTRISPLFKGQLKFNIHPHPSR